MSMADAAEDGAAPAAGEEAGAPEVAAEGAVTAEVAAVETRLALARLAFSSEMSALSEAIETAPRGSTDKGVLDTATEARQPSGPG